MIAETGALIEVDALPEVLGDAIQLGQLFQNLLSIALKFSRAATSGRGTAGISRPPQIQIRL
jgi:light-regulated signal transduction histidine kinase (bacteriophytochrome)